MVFYRLKLYVIQRHSEKYFSFPGELNSMFEAVQTKQKIKFKKIATNK